jgi:hypothetical protein
MSLSRVIQNNWENILIQTTPVHGRIFLDRLDASAPGGRLL